ncbi:MAG: twin-arginine translocase TatA/TatE family subunit [Proteobacteria bacterium]|nr:twin-arginine translocase TatA/TatE family subunit [Pseudomonadota bacterium]
MSPGLGSIILVVILIVLLFGRGKISALMGDLAKGITSFKKGLKEDSGDDEDGSNDADNKGEEKLEESDKS